MPDAAVTAAVLGRVVVQAGRALDVPFSEILDRYAVTRNAWWLLTELYRSRDGTEATIGEHARRSGLAASSATIATEQLTTRKLARRRRPKDNRRVTVVTITEPGIAFVERVRADLEDAVSGLYDLYEQREMETLHGLLARLVEGHRHG